MWGEVMWTYVASVLVMARLALQVCVDACPDTTYMLDGLGTVLRWAGEGSVEQFGTWLKTILQADQRLFHSAVLLGVFAQVCENLLLLYCSFHIILWTLKTTFKVLFWSLLALTVVLLGAWVVCLKHFGDDLYRDISVMFVS